MGNKKEMREQLLRHLEGGQAFTPISDFLEEVSYKRVGERPTGLPYSFYEVFYHIRYAQKDILDYCTAEDYTNPNWPSDYWPSDKEPASKSEWKELKKAFFEERKKLADFIADTDNDLMKPVKHSEDKTLLRELMLVIEHNAYHTGQLAVILRLLGLH